MKIAYCTAGVFGAGHAVRGIAIRRALERNGFGGSCRVFGPTTPFGTSLPFYEPVNTSHQELLGESPHPEQTAFAERLRAFAPDLLLVDLFWLPFSRLVATLQCEAWLLVRSCPQSWLREVRGRRFDRRRFRRVIGIEPAVHGLCDDELAPIVVVNPAEQMPACALRERLGVPPEEDVNVVVHAGGRGELQLLREVAGQGDWRSIDLFSDATLFPVAAWLHGARRVIAAAGYNSFWEAQWLGYAGRSRFVPLQRPIDDQQSRVAAARNFTMRENGADTLARWMMQ